MAKNGSFRDFIFREHRAQALFIIGLLIYHFILIRTFFPYVITIGDGNYYLRAAINNTEISVWPIGYSKLLAWIHAITKSDWAIFCFQYIILEGAVFYFYFTVCYLLRPGKWIRLLIIFCLLMNPFILCFTNYVLTDSLFAALTVLWFTLTMWYLYKPRPILVYTLVVLPFLLFTIRYYAMFYPLITVPIILFSKVHWRIKLSSLFLGSLLFLAFIRYTENLFFKKIGQREFSPFSGWQLAANALIMYRHIPDREADACPPELQPLHQVVLQNLKEMPSPDAYPDNKLQIYFTWNVRSPLLQYSHVYFGDDATSEDLKNWASMGRLYHDYGAFLIRRHPVAFVRYYVVQGIDWFINPKVDLPNVYPEGGIKIFDRVKDWFGYKSNWLKCTTGNMYSIAYFPVIINLFNLLLILGIFGFFYCECHKASSAIFNKAVALVAAYWLANFLFIIITAPFVLRYSLSVMILNIVFVPVILERIYLSAKKLQNSSFTSAPASPPTLLAK